MPSIAVMVLAFAVSASALAATAYPSSAGELQDDSDQSVAAAIAAAEAIESNEASNEDAPPSAGELQDDSDQSVAAAIAAAEAIESNEASNEDAPHDPWCWTRAGERDAALRTIAEEQAQQGNAENIMTAATLIDNHSVRSETFAGIVKEQAARIESAKLRELVKEAEAAANLITDDSCFDATLSELAVAQGIVGQLDAAFLTLDSISDDVLREWTEYEVGMTQVVKGNHAVVDEMESPLVIIMVLGEAAFREAEAGHSSAARQVIADAGRSVRDVIPVLLAADTPRGMMDAVMRILPFHLLMKAQARLGDVAGVNQTGDSLIEVMTAYSGDGSGVEAEVVEARAEAYAWAGDEGNAVAKANELEDANRREQLLKKIAEILHP